MQQPAQASDPRPTALGIDVGTSGIRAVGINDAGDICLSRRVDLPPSQRGEHPDGAAAEQDPRDWWTGLDTLLQDCGRHDQLARVRHMALDTTSGTLLAALPNGQPLSPALMYDDARGARGPIAEQIRSWALPAHLTTSALARWLWLRHDIGTEPSSARPMHQADWLNLQLSGRQVIDVNSALKFGFDPIARDWPATLRAQLGADSLPLLAEPGTVIGPILPRWRQRWGLPHDARLVAGTTDSIAAVYASDARHAGDGVTSLGSTLALKLISDRPVFDLASGVYSHCFGARFLVSGASNSGGQVLRQYFSDAQLAALSAAIDPDIDPGLDYWPLCQPGERFPINDPDFAPRLSPRPADDTTFLAGMLHGIARIERAGYARFHQLGAPPLQRVFSSGGGAHNPTWHQIRQHHLGVPLMAVAHDEPAYGVARLAQSAAN